MNIKTFMVAAVAALSVAACCKAPAQQEVVEVPGNEAAANVELNEDGSVKATEDAAAQEAEAAQAEVEAK